MATPSLEPPGAAWSTTTNQLTDVIQSLGGVWSCKTFLWPQPWGVNLQQLVLRVRRASQWRSACETATGWGAAPPRPPSSAPERTAPDRPSSTPGSLQTTAGGRPAACRSALAPPPCPGRKHSRVGYTLSDETHGQHATQSRRCTEVWGDLCWGSSYLCLNMKCEFSETSTSVHKSQ